MDVRNRTGCLALALLSGMAWSAWGAPPPDGSGAAVPPPPSAGRPRRIHGEALTHVPAECPTVAYADLAGIAAIEPVESNRELLRERARLLLGHHPDLERALHQAADTLAKSGIDWRKDVSEIASCATDDGIDLLTIGGNFEGKDILSALQASAARGGDGAAQMVQDNGRTYAQIGTFYMTRLTDRVLGIARAPATLAAAAESGPGLSARGGQEIDLAYFKSRLSDGQTTMATLVPSGGNFVLGGLVQKGQGTFDPRRDRLVVTSWLEDLAGRLRRTPAAALARSVARSDVTFQGDTFLTRTVFSPDDLKKAIAAAATSKRGDWDALFSARPLGVGGGPPPATKPAK
jgi:hypothetical protein